MPISNMQLAVGIMFVLTALSMGAAIYTTTFGNSSEDSGQVTANKGNIEFNDRDISAIQEGIKILSAKIAELETFSAESSHNHPEYAVVSHNHNLYATQSHTHSSSSSGNNGDFDLTINKRNLEVGDSFLLEGNGPRDTRYVAIMESPDREQSQTGTTNVNGEFTVAFVIPNSWDDGRYTIEVFIGDERDSINFDVDP